MRKSLLTLLLVLLAITNMAFAQERVVTGTVTQKSDGASIPGATISVKGTRTATVTNQNGKFSIRVSSPNAVLVVSFVGMIRTEITVGNQYTVDVEMVSEVTSLDEVIVVAYGTSTKKSFTGSAVSIGSKQLTLKPITNITKALEGVAPGIQVSSASGQPGAGPTIRVRGFGSVNYSGDPLFVVDGAPFSGTLANINPDDIESVSVLKDAASTALYGNKAAYGVVVVTTKKGNKDRNQIQVKIAQGFSSRAVKEYDRVSRDQYYPLMWESYRNSLINSTSPVPVDIANQLATGLLPLNSSGLQVYNGKTYSSIKQLLGMNPYNVANNAIVGIDGKLNPNAKFLYPNDLGWESALSRLGKRGDYGVSYSGGGPKSDYFVSLSYLNEKGFVIKSDYERVTGRVNINANPVNWFKTGLNLSGTLTTSNVAADASSTGFVNPFFFSRNMGPIYPIYMHNTNGDFLWDQAGNKQYDLGASRSIYPGRHVIAETNFNDNLYKRNSWTGKTFGEISFTKDLKFTTNLSVEIGNYNAAPYDNRIVGDGATAGRASRTNSLSTTFNVQELLNYNKSFGDHSFEFLAGHENMSYLYNYLYGFRQGQIADGNTELVNFTTTNSLTSTTDTYKKEGYLSRLSYNYKNRYYASASYRYDGSSKFAQKVRWGNFWSVGGSWRVSQEPFMKGVKPIEDLKVRGSYGTVGSDNDISYYVYQKLYALGVNNAGEAGLQQSGLGNLDILWETNTQLDLGLDFTLFKRITGSFDYYEKQSKNLLFTVPLPLSSGITSQDRNVGTMSNSGFELELKTDITKGNDFKWNIDVNLSTVKNVIKRLPFVEQINGTKKLMVGHSMYDYWLREYMGVDPADGSALYRATTFIATNSKIMGKDTVTNDANNARYHYAGTAIPKLYGSLTSNFAYKNFDLTVMLSFQLGGKIYDAAYAALMSAGSYGNALSTDMLTRWQKPGDITNVPRLDAGKTSQFGAASDRWLTSGTYFNLKTINFGYNMPLSLVKKWQMQNVRLYLSGDNLFLKASRQGLNPTQAFSGVTSNAYVPARIVTVGINVTL